MARPWLTDEVIAFLGEHPELSNSEAAREINQALGVLVTRDQIQKVRREGLAAAAVPKQSGEKIADRTKKAATVSVAGDEAVIETKAVDAADFNPADLGDADEIIRQHKLDPKEWVLTGATESTWEAQTKGGGTKELSSRRLTLQRRKPEEIVEPLRPAADRGPVTYWPRPVRSREVGLKERILVFCDTQGYLVHEPAFKTMLAHLSTGAFDKVIGAGDLLDFPEFSRFTFDPRYQAKAQEEIDIVHSHWREVRAAAGPDAELIWVEGNHEARLTKWLLERAQNLVGLRRPGDENEVVSVPHLLRLDEIGVSYPIDERYGGYPHSAYMITPNTKSIHGNNATKGAGNSVRKEVDKAGGNVVMGHVHDNAIITVTKSRMGHAAEHFWGMEVPMMCRADGLGYTQDPDWSMGWGVIEVYDDGTTVPTTVRFDPVTERAYFRGQVISATDVEERVDDGLYEPSDTATLADLRRLRADRKARKEAA